MGLQRYLRAPAEEKRQATAKLMEQVKSELIPFYVKKEFPFFMIDKMREIGIMGGHVESFGGPGFNNVEVGAILYELAKRDTSLATFYCINNLLGCNVINELGDNDQKQRILSRTVNANKLICFCLTEPDYGSDASGLQTVAIKTKGGYLITG